MPLATKSDIAQYRQISKSVKDSIINQFIGDAEMSDVRPLLGDRFYYSIKNSPNAFPDLLNGTTYNVDSVTIKVPPLKQVISLFAYARYVLHGSFTDTSFGFVEKQTNDSVSVPRNNRKEIYTQNRQTAIEYWHQVKKYLNAKSNLYPQWKSSQSQSKKSFRLSKISR